MEPDPLKIDCLFKSNGDGFICRATTVKDREIFDCYGSGKTKQEAKTEAVRRLRALTKLLFPIVPLAMFNRAPVLEVEYTLVDFFNLKDGYIAIHPYEITTGRLFIYVNVRLKNYVVLLTEDNRPEIPVKPDCPIELLNDPVRFTDWSQGPVCSAQENYLSQRISWYIQSL